MHPIMYAEPGHFVPLRVWAYSEGIGSNIVQDGLWLPNRTKGPPKFRGGRVGHPWNVLRAFSRIVG